jgi:hypothetical protein
MNSAVLLENDWSRKTACRPYGLGYVVPKQQCPYNDCRCRTVRSFRMQRNIIPQQTSMPP